MESLNLRVSPKEFEKVSTPLELDLIALFKVMEEDVYGLIEQANKEAWTPEEFIRKSEELLG